MFRSEKMGYYNLVMSKEASWEIINQLGTMNCLQFQDTQPNIMAQAKPFARIVKRCDDLLLKVEQITQIMKQFNKQIIVSYDYEKTIDIIIQYQKDEKKPGLTYLDQIENEMQSDYKIIQEQIKNLEIIKDEYNQLYQNRMVLIQNKTLLQDTQIFNSQVQESADLSSFNIKLNYVSGVIEQKEVERFQRLVFRVSKGNCWTYISNINENNSEKNIYSDIKLTVFIIVFAGGQQDIQKKRINKVCESFNAKKYDVPIDDTIIQQRIFQITQKIFETEQLIKLTIKNIEDLLQKWILTKDNKGNCSRIDEYKIYAQKEKLIYSTLNLFKTDSQIYQCKCWCPKEQEDYVIECLQKISLVNVDLAGGQFQELQITPKDNPPTSYRINKFTMVFQEIVNTYGIPRYMEFNPGLFTCVTFPFLFGVMFGDILHGGLLLVLGLFLILNNDSISDTKNGKSHFFKNFAPARYMIFLMGFFATYCGFIYNDMAGVRLNLFGSCYDKNNITYDKTIPKQADCVYPFGIDPIWGVAQNELLFLNSFKMKLSIVLGVLQMSVGIFLKGANAITFRQPLDFFFEFLPQIIFLQCFFGYMVFEIMYKWTVGPYLLDNVMQYPPMIINLTIDMFLKFGKINGDSLFLNNKELQESVQLGFLIIIILMIPLMLIPKPLLLIRQYKQKKINQKLLNTNFDNDQMNFLSLQSPNESQIISAPKKEINLDLIINNDKEPIIHDEHNSGEIVVHQIIETIEFVLGSISNTASYLRLWALSLAHGQLALVFIENALFTFINSEAKPFMKTITIVIGFSMLANVTFGVLMCMDVMECFLHSLRLHWVEFQNKFYKGDGQKFIPLNFKQVCNNEQS